MTELKNSPLESGRSTGKRSRQDLLELLEELAACHLENVWLQKHFPHRPESQHTHRRAQTVFETAVALLCGATVPGTVRPAVTGEALAAHLCVGLGLVGSSEESVIRQALNRYLDDLVVYLEPCSGQTKTAQLPPIEEFREFVAGWAAFLAAESATLTLPADFLVSKAVIS